MVNGSSMTFKKKLINKIGTCLTVTEFDKDSFKVGVAPETLRCTNLGK